MSNTEESMVEQVEVIEKPTDRYKTQALAEEKYDDLYDIPKDKFFLITHPDYLNGLDFIEETTNGEPTTCLKLIPRNSEIFISDNIMYVDNRPLAEVKYVNNVTGMEETEIDKPLVQAIFSIVMMKLQPELDQICPPGYSDTLSFRKKQPDYIKEADSRTLFEWYHRDLFNYTVVVRMRDLMKYLGYSNQPSKEQMDAIKKRMFAMSRVKGSMNRIGRNRNGNEEYLLLDPGFDTTSDVVFLHSPYMNKMIECIIRDRIPRMFSKNNQEMQLTDSQGNLLYYPGVTTIVRPEIVSAKNKRAVEVVFVFASLIARAGKTPHITYMELIGRCYELSSVILKSKNENISDRSGRNRIIRRTFNSVWDYMKRYTTIPDDYTYEEYIPKSTDYHYKFEFHRKEDAKS